MKVLLYHAQSCALHGANLMLLGQLDAACLLPTMKMGTVSENKVTLLPLYMNRWEMFLSPSKEGDVFSTK